MVGQIIQVLHHPQGMEYGPACLGPDIGDAEDLPAAQLLLHIGDDLEKLGV